MSDTTNTAENEPFLVVTDVKATPIAYSPAAAADAAGLTRTRIFEMIRSGELKARKAGKRTIIMHDDLYERVRALPQARSA